MKYPDINALYGSCAMRTNLSLEQLAKIISDKVFGGVPFGGKDQHIWEEIPAVYIRSSILGLQIILGEGKNDGGNGNIFVLSVSSSNGFGRYRFEDKLPNKTAEVDSYLQRVLKYSLVRFPQVEILGNERKESNKHLFRLAERVIVGFEERLKYNKNILDPISLKESVVGTMSLKIVFSNEKDKIVWSLSTHPLDMPWAFEVKVITEQGKEFELHKWKAAQMGNNETPYEVSPNLLDDPDGLGDELARKMGADLAVFLREIKSR